MACDVNAMRGECRRNATILGSNPSSPACKWWPFFELGFSLANRADQWYVQFAHQEHVVLSRQHAPRTSDRWSPSAPSWVLTNCWRFLGPVGWEKSIAHSICGWSAKSP